MTGALDVLGFTMAIPAVASSAAEKRRGKLRTDCASSGMEKANSKHRQIHKCFMSIQERLTGQNETAA
jgi:hypothetical protein